MLLPSPSRIPVRFGRSPNICCLYITLRVVAGWTFAAHCGVADIFEKHAIPADVHCRLPPPSALRQHPPYALLLHADYTLPHLHRDATPTTRRRLYPCWRFCHFAPPPRLRCLPTTYTTRRPAATCSDHRPIPIPPARANAQRAFELVRLTCGTGIL